MKRMKRMVALLCAMALAMGCAGPAAADGDYETIHAGDGRVQGTIAPDQETVIRLVADWAGEIRLIAEGKEMHITVRTEDEAGTIAAEGDTGAEGAIYLTFSAVEGSYLVFLSMPSGAEGDFALRALSEQPEEPAPEEVPEEEPAAEEGTEETDAAEETQTEEPTAEEIPAEDEQAITAEELQTEEIPAEEMPAEDAPDTEPQEPQTEETPAEEKTAEDVPAETVSEDVPVDPALDEEITAEETSTVDTPDEDPAENEPEAAEIPEEVIGTEETETEEGTNRMEETETEDGTPEEASVEETENPAEGSQEEEGREEPGSAAEELPEEPESVEEELPEAQEPAAEEATEEESAEELSTAEETTEDETVSEPQEDTEPELPAETAEPATEAETASIAEEVPAEPSTEQIPLTEEELTAQGYVPAAVIRTEGTALYPEADESVGNMAWLDAGTRLYVRIGDTSFGHAQVSLTDGITLSGWVKLEDIALLITEETEEEMPVRTIRVTSTLDEMPVVTVGTEVELRAELTGFTDEDLYTVRWQYTPDGGETVLDAEGASELTWHYTVNKQNYSWAWRVMLTLLSPAEDAAAQGGD